MRVSTLAPALPGTCCSRSATAASPSTSFGERRQCVQGARLAASGCTLTPERWSAAALHACLEPLSSRYVDLESMPRSASGALDFRPHDFHAGKEPLPVVKLIDDFKVRALGRWVGTSRGTTQEGPHDQVAAVPDAIDLRRCPRHARFPGCRRSGTI